NFFRSEAQWNSLPARSAELQGDRRSLLLVELRKQVGHDGGGELMAIEDQVECHVATTPGRVGRRCPRRPRTSDRGRSGGCYRGGTATGDSLAHQPLYGGA